MVIFFIFSSDTYRIQDEFGDTITDLAFSQIKNQSLIEVFGLNNTLRSMALQSQEEVDIFFSNSVRIIFFFKKKNVHFFFIKKND